MACTNPRKAWKHGVHEKTGKQKLAFKRPPGVKEEDAQQIPCGKCVSCKLSYSREWATRITHEIQTSSDACFITLTYDEKYLPEDHGLDKKEVQLFIKRLRKYVTKEFGRDHDGKPKKTIKYFACGEYGETKGARPHYHIIIFGYDFADRKYWSRTDTGNINYRSQTLEKLWTKGFSAIGEANFQTAAYVARYTLKKQSFRYTGEDTEWINLETGEIHKIQQEFVLMSQGIGKDWWNKYHSDTDKDYILADYQKAKVPRYYDKLREKMDPISLENIKEQRTEKALELQSKDTKSMKKSRDIIKRKQNSMLIRSYDNGN
jgi:hypothetical protein